MKISIIVPVYNVENFLFQCLTSIVGQSYRDLEIILVDDNSTDLSAKICEEFASKDSRIKFIQQANGGVSVARNTGIENASGEFLTFVDSDDWVEREMYEKMAEKIKNNPTLDLVMCDTNLFRKDSEIQSSNFIRPGYYSKNQIISELYPFLLVTEEFGKIPIVSVCNCLFRRSILIKNSIQFAPDLKYGEDYLFMPEIIVSINSYYYLKDCYYYNYRQYDASRSKKFRPDWWSNFLDLNIKLKELLANSKEYNFTRQLKLQLIHSALFLSNAIIKNEKMPFREKLFLIRKLFNEDELKTVFSNLKFDAQPLTLKIVLFLIKNKMAFTYLIYRNIISKIKT